MNLTDREIKIILVDDHKLVTQAYASMLNDVPGFIVTGQAYNGKEALILIENSPPDVVILDADMPVMTGAEALKIIHEKYPHIKVIILTMHKEMVYVSNFLINGAHAFLSKNCEMEELIKAIRTVIKEGYYFSSTVSKAIVSSTIKDSDFGEDYRQLRLTERETEVLKLICEDKTAEDIAVQLNISVSTIKFFKKNIYQKTNTNTVAGLVKYAIKNGLTYVD